jgi:hypothetical protein
MNRRTGLLVIGVIVVIAALAAFPAQARYYGIKGGTSQVRDAEHEEMVSDLALPELVLQIQDCVNRIVAAAKARSID